MDSYIDYTRDIKRPTAVKLRVYISRTEPASSLCLFFIHGAGSSALTWHHQFLQFRELALLIAPDLRGHGASSDGLDMSMESLIQDIAFILLELRDMIGEKQIILIGHSLGGCIATKSIKSASIYPLNNIAGLIVLDVAEETVLNSLARLDTVLSSWPHRFESAEDYANWCSRNNRPQSLFSARLSTPPLLLQGSDGSFYPRTELLKSKPHWYEWFEGFDALFIGAKISKLLVMSHIQNIDRQLTIAHMEGSFELCVMKNPFHSHFFHEDSPDELLHILLDFLKKKHFINSEKIFDLFTRHKIHSGNNFSGMFHGYK